MKLSVEESTARGDRLGQVRQTGSLPAAGRSWGPLLGKLAVALACAICVGFLTLPLLALLLRVPLADIFEYLREPIVADALRISMISSLCSLAAIVVFGTPMAYVLGRRTFPGKRVVETVIELPLVLPPAVAGVALLFAFGRRTPFGAVLRELNVEVAFTLAAVVLAQTFVAAPFYIKAARAGFQGVPRDLMDLASTQGAGPWQTFRHVLLPLALPAVAGGAVMAWARAVGEFGATILFAGNFQGRTQTMPLAIYTSMESDINAAIVITTILILTSFTVLLAFKLLGGKSLDVTLDA